jgi:hypothetical protein
MKVFCYQATNSDKVGSRLYSHFAIASKYYWTLRVSFQIDVKHKLYIYNSSSYTFRIKPSGLFSITINLVPWIL